MRIGLDVSGGDFAPKVNLDGLKFAMSELPSCIFYLFGDSDDKLSYAPFI